MCSSMALRWARSRRPSRQAMSVFSSGQPIPSCYPRSAMESALAATFLRARGAGQAEPPPALEERLRALCESGRRGFPELDLTDEEFVHHLAQVTPAGDEVP